MKKNIFLKEFYTKKWFKLTFLFMLFAFLFSIHEPIPIKKDELTTLKVHTSGDWRRGSHRDPIKLYFYTREYSNRFGVTVGGTYGRPNVEESFVKNNRLTIKIRKSDVKDLNNTSETILIYYLDSELKGAVFNEADFNAGEESSHHRVKILLVIVFVVCLWNILRH